MSRLGRAFPNNALLRPIPVIPVTYDATGAGGSVNGAIAGTMSWSHTISGNAVVAAVSLQSSLSTTTVSAKVGSTAMTLLGTGPQFTSSGFYISVVLFGLLNPPTGTQTLSATMSSGTNYCEANSVSYRNVAAFGSSVSGSGTSSAPALSVASGVHQMVAEAFTTFNTNPTGYTQTTRYSLNVASPARPFLIGDAPGAPTVSFSAAACDLWSAIAVPMQAV